MLKVENLSKHFPITKGVFRRQVGTVKAVDGISFEIKERETLGLVGESGCGKSTAGRVILQLYPATSGNVVFRGVEITELSPEKLRLQRPKMQMIFQDPQDSLNPRMTVGDIIGEPIIEHQFHKGKERREKIEQLLKSVGLNPKYTNRYPHEFSGGQRQRIGIARALALNPDFIICDEPIAALDVSIQAQVVNLLEDLQDQLGLTYLFISHDLGVVQHMCDSIAVMYMGKIVEQADRESLFNDSKHPYTQALLSAVPSADPNRRSRRRRITISGDPPNPIDLPPGCRFASRCPLVVDQCRTELPDLRAVDRTHWVACHLVE